MMLAGLSCRSAAFKTAASLTRVVGSNSSKVGAKAGVTTVTRTMASEARTSGFARHFERRRMIKPSEVAVPGSAFNIGRGAVAAASALGLGALAFYGLGMSDEAGAIDRHMVWSEAVRARIRDTYLYFGASLGVTAGTAAAIFRSPQLMGLVSRGGWISLAVSLAALIGTSTIARSIPYEPGFGSKQLAWLAHCATVGAVVAPICLLGGPILVRAAWYTAGMVGGLSAVAACAPSDKFLSMAGPLSMGLGVVFISSIGTFFLPPTTALGAGLYSVALYGGLIVFGGFMLYDTQKIIHRAENHPNFSAMKYDPINNSIGIYMNTINIFIRIAQALALGGGRKK